jgi:hypothetical protein
VRRIAAVKQTANSLIQMDEKENDHVLVDEHYELRSDILEQYNNRVVLKTDLLELVFIER